MENTLQTVLAPMPAREAALRAARPRSVARDVGRLCSFLLLVLATLAGTARLVDNGLRRITTSTFGVFNRIVDGQINAAILIAGSSRALTHFDPRTIASVTGRSAYNIGINGSQIDMQVAVFKTYLKHNAKPSLLVFSLDSFTFVTSHREVYFPGQYLPYLEERDIYDALRTIDADMWKARYLPLYGYAVEDMNFTWATGLRGLIGWNPTEDRYLGFKPRYTAWTGDFERFKETNRAGVTFEIEPAGVRQLEDLLQVCRDQGIPVLLVYSPVYYQMQALERNRGEIFARFRELSARYGATLWDYSDSPVSLRKEYFYNSQHLNADGAAAFSDQFARALAASTLIPRR